MCVCIYIECQRKTPSTPVNETAPVGADFWRQKWIQQFLLGENHWGGELRKRVFSFYITLYIHIHICAHTSVKNDFYNKKSS